MRIFDIIHKHVLRNLMTKVVVNGLEIMRTIFLAGIFILLILETLK